MKGFMRDILFGFMVIIAVTILEFAVTIPLGSLGNSGLGYVAFLNQEFLLTAVPAALAAFGCAFLAKIKTKSDAWRKSIVWTAMLLLNYLVIGIGNGTAGHIFASVGFYALLACAFSGPVLYARVRRLP